MAATMTAMESTRAHCDLPAETATKLRYARAGSLLLVALFCAGLVYVYISWLAPNYYYMGFPLYEGSRSVLWLAVLLLIFSASLLPLQLKRFSDYFLWMVFYFIYAPSLLFIPLQGLLPDDGLLLVCALGISFNVMRLLARYRVRLKAIKASRSTLTVVFFGTYVTLNAYVLSVYGGSLHLADFANVYDQRSLAGDLSVGSLVGYATGMLSGAFNPLLMAVGLVERRWRWFLLGAAGQIFMYSTFALKSILLTTLLTPLFYYFLVRRRCITSMRLGLLVAGSCIVPLALIPLLSTTAGGIPELVVSLIFMRTYGLAGALTGVYADFFSSHPLTYFSHINIVSSFIKYPYDQSVGEEVGLALVGSPLDANANFWATDGIAALGDVGVVLVGVVVGTFLMLANSMLIPRQRRVAFLGFIPFIMTISNTSIFTSLLSDGGGLLLVMVYLWQTQQCDRLRTAAR